MFEPFEPFEVPDAPELFEFPEPSEPFEPLALFEPLEPLELPVVVPVEPVGFVVAAGVPGELAAGAPVPPVVADAGCVEPWPDAAVSSSEPRR